MSMVYCFECGHQISDSTNACPNCGFPMSEYISYIKREKEKKRLEKIQIQESYIAEESRKTNVKHSEHVEHIIPNNEFINKLNKVSKSQEEVKYDHDKTIINSAETEYYRLKDEILRHASVHGHTVIGNKKYISYLYKPSSYIANFSYDDGTNVKLKPFGGVKITKSDYVSYTPKNPYEWDLYSSKIIELGIKDNIQISPVLYSKSWNKKYYFPTRRSASEFSLKADLYIYFECDITF